jgi:hypothetical protein
MILLRVTNERSSDRHNRRFDIVLSSIMWLGGCNVTPPVRDTVDQWRVAGSCPAAPVIGIVDGAGSCDLGGHLPPNWRARVMFEDGSPEVAALASPPPPGLARFCSYEWQRSDHFEADVSALRAAMSAYPHMQIETASPDCHAPLSQSSELERAVEFARRDAFRLDIDWVDAMRLGASDARVPVEVAVADTISAEVAATGRAPVHIHGQVVGAIISDIACPGHAATCVEHVRHTLAMPRRDGHSPPDWLEGGDRGTRGDVALAVYAAVQSWRERRIDDPAAPPRLVLNLSLGWEPDPRELAPSQALLAALRFASCNGVLVFASSGNDSGGRRNQTGPLEPARFELRSAPDSAECEELGFSPLAERDYPVFGSNEKPLVWAVGGVDANDRSLAGARPNSMPRLVAPALDGLAITGSGELTRALSGSSIAAAVASGTAALIWSHRPELRPDQIVDIIYRSGWDTHEMADFGHAGPATRRRISVCAALASACEGTSEDACPKLDCVARAPANREHRVALTQALRALHANPSTSVREHRHR